MTTTTYKVLGQSTPLATTATDLYTVPAATQTIVSSISICNQNTTNQKFRVSIRVAGAVANGKQYIYYDETVLAKDTFIATVGITLGAADVVTVYADSTLLSFNLFGSEVS